MNSPDTSTATLPRLEHLERLLDARQLEPALNELHNILVAIDRHHGELTGVLWIPTNYSSSFQNNSVQFATRFIAAYGRLICDPDFSMTAGVFEPLQQFSRWIEALTSLSGFDSADSFARRLGEDTPLINIGPNTVLRFLSVYLPSSSIDLSFDVLRNATPAAFYVTALSWLGSRYCFRKEFCDRREALLEWIPGKLQDVTLGEITLANITEPYFHVSYAFTPHKHAIKADLISQLRQCLLKNGCLE